MHKDFIFRFIAIILLFLLIISVLSEIWHKMWGEPYWEEFKQFFLIILGLFIVYGAIFMITNHKNHKDGPFT